MSLTENNSMYLQGTIPLSRVKKYTPSAEETNRLRFCTRVLHDSDNQPVAFARRDCSTIMVPRFGTEHVRANMSRLYGVRVHDNCNDNETDFTYAASTFPNSPPVPENSIYLWSSYRYVRKYNTSRKQTFLYYTLRQFYGENVTLSRTRTPVLLLP
ncbi:hypothetical protein WA026_015139 [Henosepilachna vigintioctopunctata]|uniref:Uncharacterized protein n=1 Tax=Henosepilachna vigintioctopunctata TaxID=420089 RepID=A0AAW1TTE7_9CUCU